jgi:hypothetical protein
MSRSYYTRTQIIETLEIGNDFLVLLEEEAIVSCDAPADATGEFSERMLERARVAYNLTHELEVNLAGAAIIVRMREQMQRQRQHIERFLSDLEESS